MKRQAKQGKAVGMIEISAKCSDLFSCIIKQIDKPEMYYNGYVPKFFPSQHFGDYIMLDIDLASGRILNWKQPSQASIAAMKGRN